MDNGFYIQKSKGYVGNSMLWWKYDNCGYVCDIRQARIFTGKEAREICRGRGRYARKSQSGQKMWPKDYIDKRIGHHIDVQDCDWKQALNEQKE